MLKTDDSNIRWFETNGSGKPGDSSMAGWLVELTEALESLPGVVEYCAAMLKAGKQDQAVDAFLEALAHIRGAGLARFSEACPQLKERLGG